ncbi:phosphoesterase [Lentilactobacillus parakefiri]|uniref:metallophosphoesterase n=1 Tax=Lentilactobacillus parakefiri TaxID=152332 RepID=UPI000BA7199B|nr:metallophosphoesterase [Lentilactobacillus parakefiri]PAK99519.1 phosphoesterase [Lentilactobacillus parakefiri]
MVKIAVTSDNHLDLNKVALDDTIKQQADFLKAHSVDIYLIAGDLFNDFQKSANYVKQLSAAVDPVRVFFIAGNHDMIKGVSYEELEKGRSPGYLNNQFFDIQNTDYRIIGINGWYDYTFAANENKTETEFHRWKMAYWIDGLISQPMSDPAREQVVLSELTKQLRNAQLAGKKVILMTHFVPNQFFIHYTTDFRFWNMANAMMGSLNFQHLIDDYQVEIVIFGHIHKRLQPIKIRATTYYNAAVGYHNRRHNEWQTHTFLSEWEKQLKMFELF